MEIYTVTDLLKAAAEAYESRDSTTIENLIRRNNEWLQPGPERDAQNSVLEALFDAIENLEYLEGE